MKRAAQTWATTETSPSRPLSPRTGVGHCFACVMCIVLTRVHGWLNCSTIFGRCTTCICRARLLATCWLNTCRYKVNISKMGVLPMLFVVSASYILSKLYVTIWACKSYDCRKLSVNAFRQLETNPTARHLHAQMESDNIKTFSGTMLYSTVSHLTSPSRYRPLLYEFVLVFSFYPFSQHVPLYTVKVSFGLCWKHLSLKPKVDCSAQWLCPFHSQHWN